MSGRLNAVRQALEDLPQPQRRAAAAVFISAVLGVAFALLAAQTSGNQTNPNDTWSLPDSQDLSLASSIDTILAEPLFGGEPVLPEIVETVEDVTEDDVAGDPWRFMGIVTEGAKRYAVIRNETLGKLQHVQPGELLPGGERLVAVKENSITYEDQTSETEISLFRDASRTKD